MNKNLQQLQLCDISGGTWIDAGCGRGTYTFPLATLVDMVIGVDKSSTLISRLNNSNTNKAVSFQTVNFEFEELSSEPVDGVLFAFSLHYLKHPEKTIRNALTCLRNNQSSIIIIEYTTRVPVPWIPHPIPLKKIESILKESFDGVEANLVFKNDRYYILKITSKKETVFVE